MKTEFLLFSLLCNFHKLSFNNCKMPAAIKQFLYTCHQAIHNFAVVLHHSSLHAYLRVIPTEHRGDFFLLHTQPFTTIALCKHIATTMATRGTLCAEVGSLSHSAVRKRFLCLLLLPDPIFLHPSSPTTPLLKGQGTAQLHLAAGDLLSCPFPLLAGPSQTVSFSSHISAVKYHPPCCSVLTQSE